MANYNAVRLDKLFGTDSGVGLVNFVYEVGAEATAIENGMVVTLGALETGEREVYAAGTPAAADKIGTIALVASPENVDDERLRNITDFRNEAGDICRGYLLHSGDKFSVTKGCLSGTEANFKKGSLVELKAATTWNVVITATDNSTQIGIIDDVENDGVTDWYVIKVA